jgi:hypothetical protein
MPELVMASLVHGTSGIRKNFDKRANDDHELIPMET